MENKDAKLIRKFITLAESVKPKTDEIINEEEVQNIEVHETEEPIDEQVKMFQDAIKTLARAAGEEKALWQTIKNEIPAIGAEYKTLKDFQLAAEAGKIGAAQSAELVKFAIKNSPELAMKMKGLLRGQPEFAEIAKQVFPKGTLNPADPRKMEIAKKTLSQMGIEGKEAEQMLKKAAQDAAGTGGVSKKAVDKAIANRAKQMKGASAEVKAVETNVKSGTEASNQIKKAIDGGGGLAARWKDKFLKGSEYLKKYKPNMFEKLRAIKSKLNWKNMILYGLAGWGTIEILKSLFGDDDKGGVMPDCVVNLEGMEWGATSDGGAMIYTKNEFDAKSKGHGGLKFYPNNRVWTMDNAMSGSYACKSGKLQVNEEEMTEQASNITITWDEKGEKPTPIPVPTGDTKTETGTTITYTECKGFPLTYGCKGDEIKKIQVCIGLPGKYQTGNYGPITMKALGGLKEITKEKYDEIVKKCEGGQGPITGSTSGNTTTVSGTTSGSTSGNTTTVSGTTSGDTKTATVNVTGETPSDLYARLVKAKTLVGRLRGRRIVYKGPDLTKEEREKLEVHMKKMGYRVSRDNFDYRKGDKIVFKRNKDEETTEPTGVTQEPTK
jgi:hypothetical protein